MSSEAWKSLFDVIALVLLFLTAVAGVGVLIFGNKVNKEQATRLRQFDSDLTKAKSDLATQQERAAKADAAVAGLQKGVASAETEMAKQQTKAATAELALLELQQRLKHRRISAEDHKKMVLALQPFHGSVVELTKLKEPEAEQFADDLISVFSEAKWSIRLNLVGNTSPPKYGLACAVNESALGGHALSEALRKLPTANVRNANTAPPIVAVIFVGLKPPT